MNAPAVLVAIHDVAPATLLECRRLVQWVNAIDRTALITLLAVPRFHGGVSLQDSAECRRWLDARVAFGDEIALHGELHRDDAPSPATPAEWWRRRVLTASEGELATFDAAQTRACIERGLAMFERCGWRASGFVPPAWRMSVAATAALRDLPLDYCTDTRGFHLIPSGMHERVPVIGSSSRTQWRRILSRRWLELMLRATASVPCVRVALHPEDARHRSMQNTWQRVLERLLTTRRAMTKRTWVTQSLQSNAVGSARLR